MKNDNYYYYYSKLLILFIILWYFLRDSLKSNNKIKYKVRLVSWNNSFGIWNIFKYHQMGKHSITYIKKIVKVILLLGNLDSLFQVTYNE